MSLENVKPPEQFQYFNHQIVINKHFEFTCHNRIFFSSTAFKDLKNHRYTFQLEILSMVNELGLATDFHLIDQIYREHIALKLDNCVLNETLPAMNTTAENIAYWIFEQFSSYLPKEDTLLKVTLYENDKQGISVTK